MGRCPLPPERTPRKGVGPAVCRDGDDAGVERGAHATWQPNQWRATIPGSRDRTGPADSTICWRPACR
eukprot:173153-Rhodomonas_salina.1